MLRAVAVRPQNRVESAESAVIRMEASGAVDAEARCNAPPDEDAPDASGAFRLRHEKAAGLQRTTSLAHRTSRIQHCCQGGFPAPRADRVSGRSPGRPHGRPACPRPAPGSAWRSEEHTSELPSLM